MKLILQNLARYKWNKRALTEADFHRHCRRERITVVEKPMDVRGIYAVVGKRKFIFLDSKMDGTKRLHVMFHELAHHYLHAPSVAFFHATQIYSKDDKEADAMAAIALIPLNDLLQRNLFEEYPDDKFLKKLLRQRWDIYRTYGL